MGGTGPGLNERTNEQTNGQQKPQLTQTKHTRCNMEGVRYASCMVPNEHEERMGIPEQESEPGVRRERGEGEVWV